MGVIRSYSLHRYNRVPRFLRREEDEEGVCVFTAMIKVKLFPSFFLFSSPLPLPFACVCAFLPRWTDDGFSA